MSPIVPLKRCPGCKQEFPATAEYFYRHPAGKYGLQPKCKTCQGLFKKTPEYKAYQKQYNREYRQRPSSRERKNELRKRPEAKAKRREYDNRPENKQKTSARRRKQYWTPEGLAYARTYHQRPEERERRRKRRRTPEMKEYMRVYIQNRNARIDSLPYTLTKDEWLRAIEYFNRCCAICGRQLYDMFGAHTVSLDHWIPLSSPDCPGTIAINVVPLCHGIGGCNNRKCDRDAFEWLCEYFGTRKAKEILKRILAYFEWVKAQS